MDSQRFFARLGLQLNALEGRNFQLDLWAAGTFSVFNVVFNQFYLPMAIQQGASSVQIGLLAAAPAIGLIFSSFWASWIERGSPLPFVIYPALIGRLLLVLPALIGTPVVFVATALVFHLLMGIQSPAYAALITRIYPPQLRGRLMGYVRVVMGALMIPLAYFIGAWTDAFGPSGPLLLAALTGAGSILFFFRLRMLPSVERAPVRPVALKRASFRQQWELVKENRELAIFLLATTFSGFTNILSQPLYQMIQVQQLQLTNVEIGVARVVYFTFLLVSFFVVGKAVDRFSPRGAILWGIAAFAAVPMLYGLFGNYAAVLAGSGIQGIGDAIWDIGILTYIFRLVPGREAVVFGLHLMLFGVRGTIGPLLSTGLSESVPLGIILIVASVIGWVGFVVFLMAGRGGQVQVHGR